ncbi:MAG: hypothetical protein Q8O92_10150 [Candidatus Latescibacter sp.]|nr:hypothetical protein [Candidatus Latescibacter sp.]
MKNFFLSILIANVLMLCALQKASAWDLPLNIDIFQIQFNHTTDSSSSDAITIRKNNGSTIITAPEYNNLTNPVTREKFAYVRNNDASVKAKFMASPFDCDSSLTIDALAESSSSFYDVGPVAVWFNGSGISIENPGNNPYNLVTFSKTQGSSLPNSVGKKTGGLKWRVTKIGPNTLGTPIELGTTSHDYYTLLSAPDSFYNYADNEAGIPWSDALDLACDWASGQSTKPGCISYLTSGLYNYQSLQYGQNSTKYDSGTSQLYFKALLDSIDILGDVSIDCVSYANLLCLLAYSIGMPYSEANGIGYIGIKDGVHTTFTTNTLLPAPYGSASQIYYWLYHQIVYFYDESQYDNFIADAAARAYNGGSPILSKGDVTYSNYLQLLTTDTGIIQYPSSRTKPTAR